MIELTGIASSKIHLFFLETVFLVLLFLIATLGESVLSPLLIVCISIAIIFIFVGSVSKAEEFRFLIILCVCSFLLRVSLAIIINSFAVFFGPDAGTYDRDAWNLAQELRRGQTDTIMEYNGYTRFVAAIYFVFGHTLIGAKIVNGFLGTLVVIFIYFIVKEIYGNKVAGIASLLVAFFPSLILWSALLLKDTLTGFLIVLAIWNTMRLHNQFRIRSIIILLVSIACLTQLRYYIVPFIAISIFTSFFIRPSQGLFRSISIAVIVILLFAVAWQYMPEKTKERYDSYSISITEIDEVRSGFAVGGSEFTGEMKINSYTGALKFLPLGLLYYFFGLFPWQAHGLRQIVTIPEVLIWYCLVPFMIYGFIYAVKKTAIKAYLILIYTMLMTLAYTFGITNMGALYRFRAQMLVFYFIFVALGITRFRDRKLNVDEQNQSYQNYR